MRDASNSTSLREHVLLFSRFLRSPRTVGALTPSSRALGEAMVAGLDLSRPARIVELGPGTGALTAPVVEKLGPDHEFLAVDIDPAFCERIHKRWPGIRCVCGSAERLDAIVHDCHMHPVDHILSGLPFVSLPGAVTQQILRAISKVLRPGGTFTTFQYIHAYKLPSGVAFRRAMTGHMGALPHVRFMFRNFPPTIILRWTKQG